MTLIQLSVGALVAYQWKRSRVSRDRSEKALQSIYWTGLTCLGRRRFLHPSLADTAGQAEPSNIAQLTAAPLDIQSGNWSEISIAGIQFARAEFLREDSCLSGWNLSQIEKREFSFQFCNKTEMERFMISDEGRNFSPQQSRGFHTTPSRRLPHFRALIKQFVTDMNSYS